MTSVLGTKHPTTFGAAVFVASLNVLIFSIPAFAQDTIPLDPTQEARDAAASVNISAGLTQENVETVVEPYETDTPPETWINPATIDNEVDERLADDTDVGTQAHQDLWDSTTLRPEYDLPRDSELNEHTENIVDNSELITEEVFDVEGTGICTEDTFEQVPMFEAFCERTSVFDERTCSITRDITTDREDTFLCDVSPDKIERACDQELRIICEEPELCMANALNLRELSVTRGDEWSGYGYAAGRTGYIKGATAKHLKARFNWFLEFWGPEWEVTGIPYWGNTTVCWNNKYTLEFDIPANVNITGLQAIALKGHETFKMSINGQEVFNNGPRAIGHNCLSSAPLNAYPDVDLLPHMQAGTNRITIDHIMGYVGHVEFFLLHQGACCQNPQEFYEEVSCRE